MRPSNRRGRPVGADGDETRRRITAATMKCVAEVGYARATIREIARTAGVTSSTLYNYFPNKSALIEAAVAARTDTAMPRLRRAADGPGDPGDPGHPGHPGNIVARFEAVLDECGRLMREYPDLAAFEFAIRAEASLPRKPKPRGKPEDRGFEAFRALIDGVVRQARERGELDAQSDPAGVVAAIYALVYGLTELAATLPAEDYHAALGAAKVLVRGTLLGTGKPPP
ncbi:TetR/AcrR family transcriptional regulator [Mycobacterium sherrisii]|uniref:TetR family transcriptional regulator n=1 Tax=Mycobacterium sherrisii TaxID=243061 RepID=A0A1E3T2T5_9MYCO|nr:TetR/AcrR family transcriptional regulator [Mycobacterium sherrisii]MCV7029838.1 TetR/AcrR family transcriptional regulator [Mycobacterium sherrisii]MEC4762622.1 TetR/AcrR family transcriptional regulator [Mycobacterium sherrisii]ODR08736.1 TetR family transcriptional regulator [Mycobacterium sherrisii]ORW85078.1 TetR family transcriptional regulator [Mycobacterium sherrisii]